MLARDLPRNRQFKRNPAGSDMPAMNAVWRWKIWRQAGQQPAVARARAASPMIDNREIRAEAAI